MSEETQREERRQFVRDHRTAIFGYARQGHGPSMSVVYYVMNGDDELLVTSMRDRAKTKAVRRLGRTSLCVLDEQWPLSYLQVYCEATIEDDMDAAVDLMMRITALMAGKAMPDSARADVQEMCEREHRVVVHLKPYATFQTPPRHVQQAEDLKGLTHWVSQSLPW